MLNDIIIDIHTAAATTRARSIAPGKLNRGPNALWIVEDHSAHLACQSQLLKQKSDNSPCEMMHER